MSGRIWTMAGSIRCSVWMRSRAVRSSASAEVDGKILCGTGDELAAATVPELVGDPCSALGMTLWRDGESALFVEAGDSASAEAAMNSANAAGSHKRASKTIF